MRTTGAGTITQALIDTQKDASRTPYIDISINDNAAGGVVNYWSRLEYLEYHEEAYRDRAIIGLNNRDNALDGIDMDGQEFAIKLGYDTTANGGGATDTVTYPALWVKSHQIISDPGERIYQIYAEGMWMYLREQNVIAGVTGEQAGDETHLPYGNTFNRTHTPEQLMQAIVEAMGWTWTAVGSAAYNTTDGIIDGPFKPVFEVNAMGYENAAALLYRLIWMTKHYLRAKAGKVMETVYPETGNAVNETYYSDKADWFWEYVEKTILLVPNSIAVLSNQDPESGEWNPATIIVGTAEDAAQIAKYTTVLKPFLAGSINNQVDANNRASAILTRLKSEILGGRLVAPHDAQLELYDKVSVEDTRS